MDEAHNKSISWSFHREKVLYAFLFGIVVGGAMWAYCSLTGNLIAEPMAPYLTPFGSIPVNMLKMVVVPVVFFSLLYGSASLPIKKLGRVGGGKDNRMVYAHQRYSCDPWFSTCAANKSRCGLEWQKLIDAFDAQTTELAGSAAA